MTSGQTKKSLNSIPLRNTCNTNNTKTLRKVYIDMTKDGKKQLEDTSLIYYRNNLFENNPRERSQSRSREMSMRMKFHSNLKLSH